MELKRMGFSSAIKKINGKTIQVYSVMENKSNTTTNHNDLSNLPF